ncbi:hypothetical protein Cni_G13787 [Canna indica]|uniref:Reverse transcriptase domain-containing protein n=1 Tax=Canna indica TaxID=4628 RepID=A0AAQ3KAI9_9LILI|nr:hypothetical protein Cni_G13787 [Canna indica]
MDELWGVVRSLKNHKSPGGISMEFFKKYWDSLKVGLLHILNNLQNLPSDLSRINTAYITLIAKTAGASLPRNYRPISLENSLVKLFSKLMANRLAAVLPSLVDLTQGAFISGCSSIDCYMTIYEALWACKKYQDNSWFIKVDFEKAFDSVNWDFITDLLSARGFPPHWIRWVSFLLNSAASSLLINGSVGRPFSHKRGLRQVWKGILKDRDILRAVFQFQVGSGADTRLWLDPWLNDSSLCDFPAICGGILSSSYYFRF